MQKSYLNAIHQIIYQGHFITDSISKILKPLGITEPQYNVLRTLNSSRGKPLNLQDIQANMIQHNSNVTRINEKLIQKGLVTRVECAINRRKIELSITKKGQQQLKALNAAVLSFHKQYQQNLSSSELEQLGYLVKNLFQ